MTQLVIESKLDLEKITPETVVEVTGKVTKEDRSTFNNIEIKECKFSRKCHLYLNLFFFIKIIQIPVIPYQE